MPGRSVVVLSIVLFSALFISASSEAAGVLTLDPSLPPTVGEYTSALDVITLYNFPPPITSVQTKNSHLVPDLGTVVRDTLGADERATFSVGVTAEASVGGGAFGPSNTPGLAQVVTFGKIGNVTGTFQTEMLALDLSGGGAMIRESPTMASLGQTTITDLGGGLYRVESFFDVFTELSLDGGQNWLPATGPTHMVLTPEPGTCALVALAALAAFRRRRMA